ncbi:MAG TPA: prephenate dehydrogenase/arogenate dehydrogenase family protein [Acidimicrobiales bacterium]|jgi:prephenate dehydrogenase|nr:prephenate dehydrogenase/arogenate dehydrogenase family protein [Acidimicrobiales bacterium]
MTSPGRRRAQVVGTGLIGASIALGLRERGWHVTGADTDADRADQARRRGALDAVGEDGAAEVTFVATPVATVADAARRAVAGGGVVTDVGSVKAPVVAAVGSPRFIGGHPMAGSEQEGLAGADGSLFEGATWVLTPTQHTDPAAYARVQAVVSSLGASVVAIPPERHDALVALVSHVPHLTAASLMCLAAEGAVGDATLLRLAAGGFRDMTRVAAGHPGIWPDICAANRQAIVEVLDGLVASLAVVRRVVAAGDRAGLLRMLEAARAARVSLPARVAHPEDLAELRVPVADRPGVLAEVTTLAGELDVNIADLEIAHSAEGDRGVLLLVVDAADADRLRAALGRRGYRPSVRPLT